MILEVGDELFPLAEVVATPAEEAASIEVVAGYFEGHPFGARALVRDGEGHVIYGAPVEWSLVEGELALHPFDITPLPPEYTMIDDACVPPPTAAEPRRAILRAQLGALSDELELEWTAMPPETASEEPFAPAKTCVRGTNTPDDPAEPGEDDSLGDRGCNCASTPGAGLGGWAWLLLLLGLGRRRGRAAQG
jgi:MYXO-CTERM domain-containing protein